MCAPPGGGPADRPRPWRCTAGARSARRISLVVLVAAATGSHSLACKRAGAPTWGAADEITIGIGRDFFDGPDSRAYVHGSTQTWEGLTDLDDNLEAQPRLAESWKSEEGGRVWTFRLRRGVRFHDGSLVEPSDVIASINRIRQHPKYDPAGVYRAVVAVAAQGPDGIVFRLREPCPALPNLVAYYSSPILKASTFGADGTLKGLVATGPYRLIEIRRGEAVVTKRFDEYWGRHPTYDRVTFRTIPDARTRVAALLSGEVDAVADVGAILPTQVDALRRSAHVLVGQREVATTHYLFSNCARPAFAGREVRRWLAAVIGRRDLVAAVVGTGGVVASDAFSRLARTWASGLIDDPARSAAPPPPSAPVRIVVSAATVERWPYLEIVQHVEDRLRRSGWPATIAVLEAGAYQETLKRRDFDLVLQPSTLMTGDPDFFYSYYLHTSAPHCFGCGSATADALIESARHETSLERRRDLYRQLASIVAKDLPVLPLYHDVSAFAYRDGQKGFSIDAQFRPVLTRETPRSE